MLPARHGDVRPAVEIEVVHGNRIGGWGVAGVGAGAEGEKIGGQAVFAAVDLQQYRAFARAEALAALHFDAALPALGQFG